MLDRAGAAQVVAIEANARAFLKCLIVKELVGLPRVEFLCGDSVAYLRDTNRRFDVCVASGILYHMQDPAELIALLADRCREQLYLWTHYYDRALIDAHTENAAGTLAVESTHTSAFDTHSIFRNIRAISTSGRSSEGGRRPVAG